MNNTKDKGLVEISKEEWEKEIIKQINTNLTLLTTMLHLQRTQETPTNVKEYSLGLNFYKSIYLNSIMFDRVHENSKEYKFFKNSMGKLDLRHKDGSKIINKIPGYA